MSGKAELHPRLKEPAGGWLFHNPALSLCLRPWMDRAALRAITRCYMPLARAWAAAVAARGDPRQFWVELPAQPGARDVQPQLKEAMRRHQRYGEVERDWENGFFGATAARGAQLVYLEAQRRLAAKQMVRSCATFLPLALRGCLPNIKWDVRSPQAVAAGHAGRLGSREQAFPVPVLPVLARSHSVAGPLGDQFWLRFASPALQARHKEKPDGQAWAHVYEPANPVADRPTLIFLHGLCMEPEYWPDVQDPLPALSGQGVRVIRAEGPWHGRRRMAGHYGGEPILARGPLGLLELLEAWIAEIAVLVAWAHSSARGPVAIAGVSLGALTGQVALTAATHWPEEMRPDAALLVATSGDLLEVVERGSLAAAIGLPGQLAAAGWTSAELTRWLSLAAPVGEPALPVERIVMVLGSADTVTPFAGGHALAERWGLPPQNRFTSVRGHFSAAAAAVTDDAPLRRLLQILGSAPRRER
jgi:pimeloyl-ACP methyl ester carboxylesterase